MALFLICACGISGPDVETLNRRLLDPIPADYQGWYTEVGACLTQSGDFGAIVWYVADEVVVDGTQKLGIVQFPNAITMRTGWTRNRNAVKHEMIHHIRQVDDDLHATDDFDRCS